MKSIRRFPVRAILPTAVAAIAAVASLVVLQLPNPDSGIHLAYENGEVVIASVDYGSAAQGRVQPGAIVTWLDDRYVLAESDQAKHEVAGSRGPWASIQTTTREGAKADQATFPKLVEAARRSGTPWLADPENNPVPTCYLDGSCAPFQVHVQADGSSYVSLNYWFSYDQGEICVLADGNRLLPVSAEASTLPAGTGTQSDPGQGDGSLCVSTSATVGASTYGYVGPWDERFSRDMWTPQSAGPGPTVLGWMILLIGWLVVGRGWVGSALKPYALTLPVATAVPLLVLPIDRYPLLPATVLGSLLVPLAMLPLAIDFLGRVEGRRRRVFLAAVTVGLALASAVSGVLVPVHPGFIVWRAFLAGCVAFVPGLFAARPFHRSESRSGSGLLGWRAVPARVAALVPGPCRRPARALARVQIDHRVGPDAPCVDRVARHPAGGNDSGDCRHLPHVVLHGRCLAPPVVAGSAPDRDACHRATSWANSHGCASAARPRRGRHGSRADANCRRHPRRRPAGSDDADASTRCGR